MGWLHQGSLTNGSPRKVTECGRGHLCLLIRKFLRRDMTYPGAHNECQKVNKSPGLLLHSLFQVQQDLAQFIYFHSSQSINNGLIYETHIQSKSFQKYTVFICSNILTLGFFHLANYKVKSSIQSSNWKSSFIPTSGTKVYFIYVAYFALK